jgi:hypothetical protein
MRIFFYSLTWVLRAVSSWEKKNRIVLVFFHILGLAAGAHRPFADPLKPFTTFLAAIVLSLQPLRRNIDIDRPTNGTHPGIHLTRCIIRQDDNPIGQE